jgi:hypothetical protein
MSDKMIPDLLLARQEMLDRLEDLSIKGFLEAYSVLLLYPPCPLG